MSSSTLSTELRPEAFLRRVVIIYGIGATLVGLGILLALPLPIAWRAAGALLWIATNARQLWLIAKGYKRCRLIRIESDGTASLQAPDGCWIAATILNGSVVVGKLAWLRFVADDGQHFAELLREQHPGNNDWRRLQLIWRHLGASR